MNRVVAACAMLVTLACSGGRDEEPHASPGTGLIATETGWVFRSGDFTLGPGEERSVCWAADVPVDLSIKRFSITNKPSFHHFLLSSADEATEPDGASDCDVLFRVGWKPMFVAAAGSAEIDMPEGAARNVAAGSQLVLQVHLVNSSDRTVSDFAEVVMERSPEQDPSPVGLFVFGTTDLALPPNQRSSVEAECLVGDDVRLFALMPHMHHLGRKLTLEVGADDQSMSLAYTRDPFDFDGQTIEPFELEIFAGTMTRVTCSYDNDRGQTITFGESTRDEMCFAIGFAVGSNPHAGMLDDCASRR